MRLTERIPWLFPWWSCFLLLSKKEGMEGERRGGEGGGGRERGEEGRRGGEKRRGGEEERGAGERRGVGDEGGWRGVGGGGEKRESEWER